MKKERSLLSLSQAPKGRQAGKNLRYAQDQDPNPDSYRGILVINKAAAYSHRQTVRHTPNRQAHNYYSTACTSILALLVVLPSYLWTALLQVERIFLPD